MNPIYDFIPHLRSEIPEVTVRIGLIENATVMIQSGYDGVVIDPHRRVIKETNYYSTIWRTQVLSGDIVTDVPTHELDQLFVGFDSAWFTYYHWLCFAIGSSRLAASMMDPAIPIGFPDYDDRLPEHPIKFSKEVYTQSIKTIDPARLKIMLRGEYKVRRLYLPYILESQNTDATFLPIYRSQFTQIASSVDQRPMPNRVFVSRSLQGANSRITSDEDTRIEAICARYGFQKVFLETLDFNQQVELFANAEAVIGPHGGGLTNMLFARPGTKLIELTRMIDEGRGLRPWFYAIAAASQHQYAFLNADAGDFSAERIEACFKTLGLSPRLSKL